MSLGSALRAGDRAVTANFALKNEGSSTFDGCFGPSWGVSVITGGHDAGQIVRSDHPSCDERLTLLPGQTIVWSKKVPLSNLRSGAAKVTGWVKVLDPAACGPRTGCREISIPSPSTTVSVGEK
jgi:hypothetical protein